MSVGRKEGWKGTLEGSGGRDGSGQEEKLLDDNDEGGGDHLWSMRRDLHHRELKAVYRGTGMGRGMPRDEDNKDCVDERT